MKYKPKILMVGTADNIGGAARVGWDLGQELLRRKFQVRYIVAYKKTSSKNVYELQKNKITAWLDKVTPFNVTSLSRHLLALITANDIDWGAADEIINHPSYRQSDIVHLHNLHGNYFRLDILEKICNEKKVVWTMHDMWPITAHCAYCYDCGNWRRGKHHTFAWGKYGNMLWDNSHYLWNKKKEIYGRSPMQLVSSSAWLDSFVKKSILSGKKSTVILNAVDTGIFKPGNKSAIRKKLNLPTDKTIISYINQGGKDDPRKGGYYFHQTANRFKNDESLVFLCIGGGKRVYREGNILYIPFVNQAAKLANYYQASDIFLFTSLADNCPLVPLEAMSTGLPVVSFDVGGVKEEIKHKKNGYIAGYKSLDDLEMGIKYYLTMSPKRLQQVSKTNRLTALDTFNLAKMADKYLRVYFDL